MTVRELRTRIVRSSGGAILGVAIVGGGIALAADHAVAISGFSFSPAQITIAVGDTITWTNSDAQAHTASADDGAWDSGPLPGTGATRSVTFQQAGTFPYHCDIHPTMTGTVTVQAAGATAPATDAGQRTSDGGGSDGGLVVGLAIAATAWVVTFAIVRRRLTRAR